MDGDGGAVAGFAGASESGRELDSWLRTMKGTLNSSSTAETTTKEKYLRIILSVLCQGRRENVGQVYGKFGAWHDFIEPGGSRLFGQAGLHVG